jgi:hypothetical protein
LKRRSAKGKENCDKEMMMITIIITAVTYRSKLKDCASNSY